MSNTTLRSAAQQALAALENARPMATEDDCVQKVKAHEAAVRALRAALAAAVAEPVPSGFKLVPEEPTEAMIAAMPFPSSVTPRIGVECYQAMLSAAPAAPPQREPLTDEQIEDLAHREAWKYQHSSDPHHSHTYTFNRTCLLEFARKLLAASAPKEQA